jgi:hypothetical protein
LDEIVDEPDHAQPGHQHHRSRPEIDGMFNATFLEQFFATEATTITVPHRRRAAWSRAP